jgi:hypothetical protein
MRKKVRVNKKKGEREEENEGERKKEITNRRMGKSEE